MLFLIALAVFAVLAVVLMCVSRMGAQPPALGSMSEKWLAENRASRH